MKTEGLRFPKPEPRARTKRRKDRVEDKVAQKVRAIVAERDGDCRLQKSALFGPCGGESEWAHLGEKKRARTRGMAPEIPAYPTRLVDALHDASSTLRRGRDHD